MLDIESYSLLGNKNMLKKEKFPIEITFTFHKVKLIEIFVVVEPILVAVV